MTAELIQIRHQPFDYQFLKGVLKDYLYPRNKISKMLKAGEIIALKSGLYVLSDVFNKTIVPETVANLLYGPSYVSLDYALAYYHIIPEEAYNITSVTSGRRKVYQTVVGTFVYHHVKPSYYSLGYQVLRIGDSAFLIARPEKALCDKLYLASSLGNTKSLEQYLFEDLRVDTAFLNDCDSSLIVRLGKIGGSKNLELLSNLVVKREQ